MINWGFQTPKCIAKGLKFKDHKIYFTNKITTTQY